MLTDLFLIRHGEPIRDGAVPYNIPPGPDLAERGRAEAAQAAVFLADKGVELLFVSPFARAAQTAAVIVEQLGTPQTLTTLVQEHGPQEQFDHVRTRIVELLAAANDGPHTRIGIVAHGSPIRAALLELSKDKIDLSKHNYYGGNPAPTCGIWHVQFVDEQTRRFELVFKPT